MLLDNDSEANFIIQNICNKLGLKRNMTLEIVLNINIKC